MAEDNRPEVNLEICSGFFRIPTNDIIYNIKVLTSNESSTTRVIEKIVEVEKKVAEPPVAPAPVEPTPPPPADPAPVPPPQPEATLPADDYFQQAAVKVCENLKECQNSDSAAEQQNSSINGLNDLAEMAGELTTVLNGIKENLSAGLADGNQSSDAVDLTAIITMVNQAQKMLGSPADDTTAQPADTAETPSKSAPQTATRYLFNFDAVFQTIYELCTNETVKEHVQKARGRAEEIFSKEKFYDALSPKVAKLQEDDGFFTIPMSDIFTSLHTACSDKGTCNLLKKMDQQKGDIFLDQFLPLEVPPTEEVEIPGQTEKKAAPKASEDKPQATSSDNSELAAILNKIATELQALNKPGSPDNNSTQTGSSNTLADGIDNAINIAVSISYDSKQIADTTKIYDQFRWVPVQESIIFMESLISQKDNNQSLTFADGEAEAKTAVDEFSQQQADKLAELLTPKEEEPDDDDESGEVGQDEIDRLLEEMG